MPTSESTLPGCLTTLSACIGRSEGRVKAHPADCEKTCDKVVRLSHMVDCAGWHGTVGPACGPRRGFPASGAVVLGEVRVERREAVVEVRRQARAPGGPSDGGSRWLVLRRQ